MTPGRRARPSTGPASVLAVALSLVLVLPLGPPLAAALAQPPAADASTLGIPSGVSAVLVEAATGQVLAATDADRRRPIASTVKLVTALVAAEALPPGSEVVVGGEVRGVEGANLGLRPGQVWDVDDLLAALLLRSGNDVAVTLAAATAGDEAGFVARMESRLAGIGIAADLASASGLADGDRLSALELAAVARVFLAEPRLAVPAGRTSVVLRDGTVLENRNRLLGVLDGASGLKTGYTSAAGWSLVGSAERDGRVLVAVVLGATDDASRTAQVAGLLEHGFAATVPTVPREEVVLRTGRGPVRLTVSAPAVTVPRGAVLRADWPTTLGPDAVPATVGLLLEDRTVGEAVVTAEDGRIGAAGRAGLGSAAADGVYAALRAAVAARLLG